MTTRRSTSRFALMLTVFTACFLIAGSALASDAWFHVRVQGGDDEQVSINLPLSLIRSAVAMIPDEVQHDVNDEVQVAINDLDMTWQDLRNFWQDVKDTPDATFATVQTRDETVAVKKEGDFLLVKTTETRDSGSQVDAKLPMSVVDALFSGPEGTLNLAAAIDALADHGPGHLVKVRDGDETVEIWIDHQNLAD
ncbi:MAG: hypothetical protein AAGE94_00390 [Acidobacteriota bacterium]